MHNTALEGSTGMNEIKQEKENFYLRFSDWMDGALWRRALVLLALSAAVITVFSVYTTPISPYYGNDSAFFLLMGKGVTQGKIPYLDLYDQKGPMIFYVNALGYLLTGDRYGIFLMQIVNLTAACLIVYRLARFWLRSGASLAVVAAYLFVYVGTVQDGNMTEEWSQLFLLLPLYLSLRFLKSGASVSEHPKWYSFVYGVCFGVLLMFRVTNAAPVGGLILAYIILFCREKKVGQLFLHAAIVLFGTALVVVPFCLYFLRVGAFDLFIYASITHNFFYATGGATARDAVGWLSIIGSVLFVPCFFAAYRPLTRCGTLDGRTYTLIGCYAAVGAVTMAFGFTYRHYFLNLAPAVVVILAVGIDWVQRTAPENRRKARGLLAAALLLCVVPFAPQVVRQCGKVVYFTCMHQLDKFPARGAALSEAIPSDRDSVWGYDVLAQDYLYADIIPCFRYFAIQRWMEDSDPQIAPEIDEMLETDPPVWVFIYQKDTEMAEKLLSLGYTAEPCSEYLIFHRAA